MTSGMGTTGTTREIETRRSAAMTGMHTPARASGYQRWGRQEKRAARSRIDDPGMPAESNGDAADRCTESNRTGEALPEKLQLASVAACRPRCAVIFHFYSPSAAMPIFLSPGRNRVSSVDRRRYWRFGDPELRTFPAALGPFVPQVIRGRFHSSFAETARSSPRRLPCRGLRKEQAISRGIQVYQGFRRYRCSGAPGAMSKMFQI